MTDLLSEGFRFVAYEYEKREKWMEAAENYRTAAREAVDANLRWDRLQDMLRCYKHVI